ncbi:MAG: tRNA preQ1(34) S-adenosylmethionine ribosyltransferase-isomerase QueA [candidate division WOR-3 bacterium]
MLVSEFDYHLPQELIAQEPAPERDRSRLLVLERSSGKLYDAWFSDIGQWLTAGDLLVLNDTRVIPARLFGRLRTGGRAELLLLRNVRPGEWAALARPARKLKPGATVCLDGFVATVIECRPDGVRIVRFEPGNVRELLATQGELALPPYIRKKCTMPERYQTVYARKDGAVAAPTAGLHFTTELLVRLRAQGVETAFVTLHAGLGTFRPVKVATVEEHTMYPEEFELSEDAAAAVNSALEQGRRVVCVGTTTVRVLEEVAEVIHGVKGSRVRVKPGLGETNLFIYPGYLWKVTGALVTNFHLPKSTLLMLVSAFAGHRNVLAAYEHAVRKRYRFYSFGDAMFIV